MDEHALARLADARVGDHEAPLAPPVDDELAARAPFDQILIGLITRGCRLAGGLRVAPRLGVCRYEAHKVCTTGLLCAW